MSASTPQALAFACHYCERRFKRLEHVQRHERTHTKETPYKCPHGCGKAFPRGDLLRRHEKSAHDVDSAKRKRSSIPDGTIQEPPRKVSIGVSHGDQSCATCLQRAANEKDAELNPALRNASSVPTSIAQPNSPSDTAKVSQAEANVEGSSELQRRGELHSSAHQALNVPSDQVSPRQQYVQVPISSPFQYPSVDPFDLFGDGDIIWDNVDFSSFFADYPDTADQGLQVSNNVDVSDARPNPPLLNVQTNGSHVEQNSISRFGSPLPSIDADQPTEIKANAQRQAVSTKTPPCYKISTTEYEAVKERLSQMIPSLPSQFALPSKHTLSRYLEGCVKGLYEHMPFVHIPTWSVSSAAPHLLLSMAAIGAQFKFEGHVAITLFYAAKAAIMYHTRTSNGKIDIEPPPQRTAVYRGSNVTPPGSVRGCQARGSQTVSEASRSNYQHDDRLQTMQAIMNLMVLGSWGPRQLVGEAIAFQSLLAELVREDGLGPEDDTTNSTSTEELDHEGWLRWVRSESSRRSKLMAYTFINLQSVAYNVPPIILTSEIRIHTPSSQEEWNAKTVESWLQAKQLGSIKAEPFADAFRSLFSGPNTRTAPSSAIGNYALIFAILQIIYHDREGCSTVPTARDTRNLRSEDIESLGQALQNWQSRWENSPESTIDPQSSSGPVAFNSTALLRLAWIRLHSDLGPTRNLASRSPTLIVETFKSCPPLDRHPRLTLALLHAAHALSVPVRLGINYVAKTQTLSWSVQHSLCNLECAIFLSKWFEAVASSIANNPLTSQEVGIISLIRSIVLETGFFREEAFAPAVDEQGWQTLIQHLGTAVASLWAEIFSGTHVFDMVSTIGASLNMYAKLLQDAHTPINGNVYR